MLIQLLKFVIPNISGFLVIRVRAGQVSVGKEKEDMIDIWLKKWLHDI